MALLWIDGFEGYGTTGALDTKLSQRGYGVYGGAYAGVGVGRLSGFSYHNTANSTVTGFWTPPLTEDPTLIFGAAFMWDATTYTQIISFYDNSQQGVNIRLSASSPSTIVVKVGGSVVDTFTDFTFLMNVWYYIEMKVVCHPTNGSIEVRLNGTTIVSIADINTQAGIDAFHNIVRFDMTPHSWTDDFYICDGSGTACNDFQGICSIIGLFPDADTETNQWTPSTGITHYNLVNENPPDTAGYVLGNVQAQEDLYSYPSIIRTDPILGIQISSMVMLNSGTSVIIEAPIVSNDIVDLGPKSVYSSSSYQELRHISEVDPNTGEPWTIEGLAAAQFGIKVM
jgi:hypothetical protein